MAATMRLLALTTLLSKVSCCLSFSKSVVKFKFPNGAIPGIASASVIEAGTTARGK